MMPDQTSVTALTGTDRPEYLLEEGLERAILDIEALCALRDDEAVIVVGVAGGSASGKTSRVAKKIAEHFAESTSALVYSLDDYMKGDAYMKDAQARGDEINWDHPDFYDLDLARDHLEALKRGEAIEKPLYSFTEGRTVGGRRVESAKIVVVESLFALNDVFGETLDYGIFVNIGSHGRTIRRLMRDVVERGLTPALNVEIMARDVEPMYRRYIAPQAERADIVISNEYNPHVEAKRAQVSQYQRKFPGTLSEEQLRELGAIFLASTEQSDVFFEPHEGSFSSECETMRLRKQGDHYSICYKGPRAVSEDDDLKVRFEFQAAPHQTEGLQKLYQESDFRIKKTRDIWQLVDGTLVFLDKNFKVGVTPGSAIPDEWVEIQIPVSGESSKLVVDELIRIKALELGLDYERSTGESYIALLRR